MEPSYIPPIPGDVVKYLKDDSVFQKNHGKICAWIAWRDGRAVGRIAAIINRSHNAYHGDKVGFFGFFDCENNKETSRALFLEAEKFLKDAELTQLRGPYNPSINDECGLLVDSFECSPFVGMSWNPAYYESLIFNSDFILTRKLYAYLISMKIPIPERICRIAQRMMQRDGWKLRSMNLQKMKDELAVIYRLYNVTLDRNWGFVPIVLEDLIAAAQGLEMIIDPNIITFAEKNGKPVGFGVSFPNINDLLEKTKKTPAGILRLLHLFWLIKTQRPKRCRVAILGVDPQYRDRGMSAWLFYEQLSRLRKKYELAELSWVEENNTEIIRNIELLGGKKYRTYHLYEKKIGVL